jgi:hypothetical protein
MLGGRLLSLWLSTMVPDKSVGLYLSMAQFTMLPLVYSSTNISPAALNSSLIQVPTHRIVSPCGEGASLEDMIF